MSDGDPSVPVGTPSEGTDAIADVDADTVEPAESPDDQPAGNPAAGTNPTAGTTGKVRSVASAAVSQGLSAGSNFLIGLGLGRGHGGGARMVGEFALAFVVYNAALGLQRALVTDALLARPFRGASSMVEDARAVTISLLLSCSAGIIVLIVGLVSPFHQLVVLAPILPILLLEDLGRYLLFRRQRPKAAVLIDGIWALFSCVGFVYLLHHPSSRAAILVWGAGGAAGAVGAIVVARLRIAPLREAWHWWRGELWVSSRWLTIEAVLFQSDQALTAFGFTAMAGAAMFGKWQITESLLGAAAFLNVGIIVMSVTHFSRDVGDRKTAGVVSLTSVCFVILLTGLLVLAAPHLIPILYSGHVHLPASIIVPTGVFLAMGSAATGPISLLRARRTEKTLPLARLVALVGFSPAAVIVARHHFTAALWILAAGVFAYFAVVAWPAYRTPDADVGLDPPFALTEADHEFIT